MSANKLLHDQLRDLFVSILALIRIWSCSDYRDSRTRSLQHASIMFRHCLYKEMESVGLLQWHLVVSKS
jgi:hypothetical protein